MFTSATGFGARSPTASTEALKGFTTVPVVHGKVPRGTGSTTSTLGAQQSNHAGAASTASFDLYQHFLQGRDFRCGVDAMLV